MPQAVTITPRKIFLEDIDLTTTKSATTTAYILGLGTTTVHPCDFISLSNLTSAASDGAAAGLGVAVGYQYYNTGTGLPKTRMT